MSDQADKWVRLSDEKAFPKLSEILSVEEDRAVLLKAIQIVFDRAYGRPTERHELTGKDGKDLISLDELATRLVALRGKPDAT